MRGRHEPYEYAVVPAVECAAQQAEGWCVQGGGDAYDDFVGMCDVVRVGGIGAGGRKGEGFKIV